MRQDPFPIYILFMKVDPSPLVVLFQNYVFFFLKDHHFHYIFPHSSFCYFWCHFLKGFHLLKYWWIYLFPWLFPIHFLLIYWGIYLFLWRFAIHFFLMKYLIDLFLLQCAFPFLMLVFHLNFLFLSMIFKKFISKTIFD